MLYVTFIFMKIKFYLLSFFYDVAIKSMNVENDQENNDKIILGRSLPFNIYSKFSYSKDS